MIWLSLIPFSDINQGNQSKSRGPPSVRRSNTEPASIPGAAIKRKESGSVMLPHVVQLDLPMQSEN